jgi:hypothetical protein
MGKVGVLVSLAILLMPALVHADCADLGRFTHWYLEGAHTVVFYNGDIPLARVEIPYCKISPLSKILLLNSYVCDSDQMMVDGVACSIIMVKVLY